MTLATDAGAIGTGAVGAGAVGAVRELALKPRLRGWLHAGMAPAVLAAGIVLITLAPTASARASSVIYIACGLALFATSGVYHVGRWGARARDWLRRADHGNIYLLIAGTYTPVVVLALSGALRVWLLCVVWTGAALGVGIRMFWPVAPRWLYTGVYIMLGWTFAPVIGKLLHATGVTVFVLILAGGLVYTAGAVIYARKRPDPSPKWFGFHEIFHSCTIAAWICQYVAISFLIYRLR
ncbi:MAG: hemolysin III family protein [Actinomycetia bacterium]|nr:hemolysin III family protein [Actinomycetes bacterium]